MKRKMLTMLATCAIMVCLIGGSSIAVHAESVNEAEPNNTKTEAQLIKANNERPSDMISMNHTNQFVTCGTTSNEDQDWFKVFLTAGTKYMSCNIKPFNFSIENEDSSYFFEGQYLHSRLGVTPYRLTIPQSGYYYVKITGMTATPSNYLFTIGSPTYALDKIEVPSEEGSITMSRGNRTETANFSLVNNSGLPKDAIVYYIRMDGLRTTSVDGISVSNRQGNSVSLLRYVWQKEGLVSMNMAAADKWRATFTYSKNTTFSPTLFLEYVYPVTE